MCPQECAFVAKTRSDAPLWDIQDIITSGVESTEPDWAVSSSRTDLRRLYVTALWFCGENIFHADVDYDVFFPGPA